MKRGMPSGAQTPDGIIFLLALIFSKAPPRYPPHHGAHWAYTVVHRVELIGQRLGFGEMPGVQAVLPLGRPIAGRSTAARPAFEVADRVVEIKAIDLFRVVDRPVIDVKPASAVPDRHALWVEAREVMNLYSISILRIHSALP